MTTRLTRKQQRKLRSEGIAVQKVSNYLEMGTAEPKTKMQEKAFADWHKGKHLMLHGIAGTGKTFLALYFAIKEVQKNNSPHKKVYIVRSVVPTRDMGYLPGNTREKTKVYEGPYYDICNKIFGRGDAYEILKQKGQLEFMSTSFIRGITLEDCIVIVDETQNMSGMELHSIMTRIGENCRIIFAGDIKQDDLTSERYNERSGLCEFMRILRRMKDFSFLEFGIDDIVRSKLIKDYIVERDAVGL